MDLLDWRYAGRDKDTLQLTADLDRGWKLLEKKGNKPDYWGFDKAIFLPDRSDPEFWCHLYVVALRPVTWESVRKFPGTDCSRELGHNSVLVTRSTMILNIPLLNVWQPTNNSDKQWIYEKGERLFSITTPDGVIEYRVQLWVVAYGTRRIFVQTEYEWGDGFAWIGGRPESNRRKF